MFSRLAGAVTRSLLVMFVIATPTVLLADASVDSQQMVTLVALFIGVLTFVEYSSVYPGLVEFRDAPPFNRIRFLMLFFTVFSLAAIERGRIHPSTMTDLIHAVGALVGFSMDFSYSPVRMATGMLADTATEAQIGAVRTAAGMSYIISLISLAFFVVMLRLGGWPRRDRPFNVWVNLPTFDPTSGGDVVTRLIRDARWNIAFGLLLPFVTPGMIKFVSAGFTALGPTTPQSLVWALTLWSFLPASLFMRGIAMGRVADMIQARRLAAAPSEVAGQYAPV